MVKERDIRIWGEPREDIDVELMAQIVIMLGRQLAHETVADDVANSDQSTQPKQNTMDLSADELGQETDHD